MDRKFRWISKGLHNNFLYNLGKLGVNLRMKGYMKEALLYFLRETQAAFTGRRPVIWCSTFIPSELVYAVGGVPFMPEVAAGFAAAVGVANEVLLEAEGDWLNADLCSIHRCGTGLVKKELVPKPDLIISSSHLCDGAKKYLQYISYQFDCPYYLLETPYQLEDAGWLAEQIRSLTKELAKGGVDFGPVFSLSNRAYRYHQRVNQLRKAVPATFSGEHAMNLVPMEFMSFGSKGGLRFYRELAEELEGRVKGGEGVIPEERYRLLWLHLKPYYPQQIFSSLREMGAVIAFEEYSQLYWELLDPEKPYLSLARKMINHFGWGPLQRQLERIYKLIYDYQIDGVIGFSQWGCRQSSGRMGMIKDSLKKKGIPFLNLDGDLVDTRNYREGQLLTRLQAFVELIDEQKGCGVC
ncbi:MAG: hypothetical protein PWR10_1320 [Halanaerobiales bacterium]|nr:hypothetical protein [Halanaerobiales bacterium]